jgi:hypothetical protein
MPNFPNRCQHLKVNGTQCGSPALRRNRFCYFHKLHHEENLELAGDRAKGDRRRRASITLPVLEDANAVQVTLMQIMRLIITGQIDSKSAGLLLYALQTASANLPQLRLAPFRHDVVLDPKSVSDTAFDAPLWRDADFEEDDEAEGEAVPNPDPRPNFIPRTVEEARNQAEIDRWCKVEADRLGRLGALQRAAQDKIDRMEDEIYAEGQGFRDLAEAQEIASQRNLARAAAANASSEPASTPAAPAVSSEKIEPPQNKRPAGKEGLSLDEVRNRVTAQITAALPAIAAAVKAHGGKF